MGHGRRAVIGALVWALPTMGASCLDGLRAAPAGLRDASRLVTLGGAVTEIVFALGCGAQVVGVDAASTYPAATAKVPRLSYQRALVAEGVLSLRPSAILATSEAGPPAALAQIESAGVPLHIVPGEPTLEAAIARIRMLARLLGRERQGEVLIAALQRDLQGARQVVRRYPTRPRVLFLYARGSSTLLVAGQNNAADTILQLAGAVNAVEGYTGYKPLTAEAAVAAAPEVILVPEAGLASIGGAENLWQLPGLALTPAGRARRLAVMDDLYLLGFGPRLGQAVRELAGRLHTPAALAGSGR